MSWHATAWQIFGTSTTAIIGVLASLYIATKNRKQLTEHGAATLSVQRVANARSAATFIADKRQNWIDDLRVDVSQYVALSAELTEAWKRLFSRLNDNWTRFPPEHQGDLDEYSDDVTRFSASIADRDSQHYQLLTRMVLRLNHDELAHNGLVIALTKIRSLLGDVAIRAAAHEYANQHLYSGIEQELRFAQLYAKVILREEWQKLKREVADPEGLMNSILATSVPDDAAVKALVESSAASVPSPLSVEHVIPLSMNNVTVTKFNENKAPVRTY
ncbi:hypothetical protein [Burkholderia sp. Z1]|uniref:hypothetical protein n=1 Tax=Burkholderia sp. Z1 TaxID=2759039 RepID=UPI001867AD71|nr:hypothetical protein [Burkholderia sp. Z1]